MEPAAFDYVAGGSWDEVSLDENVAAWRRRRFRPRVMVDVAGVDPSSTLPRPAKQPAGRRRADGLPVPRPPRRRDRGSARGSGGGDPVHAVDDVVLFDRGRRGGRTGRGTLVPAVHPGGPGAHPLARRAGRGRRVSRAIVLTVDLPVLGYRDRDRRPGWSCRPSAISRKVLRAHAGRRAGGSVAAPAPGLVHGTLVWADLATHPVLVVAPARRQGHPDCRGRPARRRARCRCASSSATTVAASSTACLRPSTCSPRSSPRSTAVPRSGSTVASGAASTSPSPGRSAPRACSSAARCTGRWQPAGAAGVERAIAILREEFALALALLGTPDARRHRAGPPGRLIGRRSRLDGSEWRPGRDLRVIDAARRIGRSDGNIGARRLSRRSR